MDETAEVEANIVVGAREGSAGWPGRARERQRVLECRAELHAASGAAAPAARCLRNSAGVRGRRPQLGPRAPRSALSGPLQPSRSYLCSAPSLSPYLRDVPLLPPAPYIARGYASPPPPSPRPSPSFRHEQPRRRSPTFARRRGHPRPRRLAVEATDRRHAQEPLVLDRKLCEPASPSPPSRGTAYRLFTFPWVPSSRGLCSPPLGQEQAHPVLRAEPAGARPPRPHPRPSTCSRHGAPTSSFPCASRLD